MEKGVPGLAGKESSPLSSCIWQGSQSVSVLVVSGSLDVVRGTPLLIQDGMNLAWLPSVAMLEVGKCQVQVTFLCWVVETQDALTLCCSSTPGIPNQLIFFFITFQSSPLVAVIVVRVLERNRKGWMDR